MTMLKVGTLVREVGTHRLWRDSEVLKVVARKKAKRLAYYAQPEEYLVSSTSDQGVAWVTAKDICQLSSLELLAFQLEDV